MAEGQSNETIIGADTIIKGDMTVESRARILGVFEGTIRAKGHIQVADKGRCKASVEAGLIHVDGVVEGNMTAKDKVELNASAKVKGDLVAPKLVVAEGAAFTGHVNVGPDAAKGGASGAAGGGAPQKDAPTPLKK